MWCYFVLLQTLSIYDRFGRLMYGSDTLAKDCLEYVVFEKHLADEYGQWRIHGKVVPDWMPSRQTLVRTLKKPKFEPIVEDEDDEKSEEVTVKDGETPQGLATAWS